MIFAHLRNCANMQTSNFARQIRGFDLQIFFCIPLQIGCGEIISENAKRK
jgi:hypothetical protein